MKRESIKRLLKYLLQLTIVFMTARYLPKREMDFKDIFIVAMISSISFAILDIYCPSISCLGQNQFSTSVGYKTLL